MGLRERSTQSRSRREMPPPSIPLPQQAFENKAGRYQLVRLEGAMVHYTFTNHHGQQADAVMPVVTWCRLHERSQAAPVPEKVVIC